VNATTVQLAELVGPGGIFTDGDWVESKDQDPNGAVRLLQLADVGIGAFLDKSARFLTSQKAAALRCTYLQPGDLMIARMPDPIGRSCIFPGAEQPCVTVVDVCILRPDKRRADPRWLLHALNSPQFRFQVERFTTGTTRKRISRKNLSSLSLQLPPLDDQRRIAAILDKADGIRRKRREAIAMTEELLRSTFLEMFGDPVTNPKAFDVQRLSGLVTEVKSGWSAKGEDRPYGDGELGVLKVSAVTSGSYKPEEHKAVAEAAITKELVVPAHGDLLFSRANTKDLVAATCIVERADQRVFLPDKLWRITTKRSCVLPEYLLYVFKHERFRNGLRSKATGTSGSMLNISKAKVLETGVPVPPLVQQEQFASVFWKSLEVKRKLMEGAESADDLFHSLVQRAFAGEL